jgi:hypothetical protein
MQRTQLRPGRKLRIWVLVAAVVALSSGGLPPTPPATAAPNPNAWVEPPALDWPATDPIVESEEVGYLPGGGSITAAGDYTYTLPIQVPDGRAGMQPHVALQYSSRGGSGLLGAGWSLDYGGSEIARCPRTTAVDGGPSAVEYLPTGALCLDGQRMIAVGGPGHAAGPRGRPPDDSARRPPRDRPTHLGARRGTRPGWDAVLYHYEVESESEAPYAFEHRIHSIGCGEQRARSASRLFWR